jgi:hypothetical protein
MTLLVWISDLAKAREMCIGKGDTGFAEAFEWLPLEANGAKVMVRTAEIVAITDQAQEGDVTVDLPSAEKRTAWSVDRDAAGRMTGLRPQGSRTAIAPTTN